MPTLNRYLEVCCGSIQSVHRAVQGGAYRVELCSGLAEGGITPSLALIEAALKVRGIRHHVLIRPRSGDFLYDDEEQDIIVRDILLARRAGADGVVVGALTPDGDVDVSACRRFVEAAVGQGDDCYGIDCRQLRPVSLTFHRAFDVCRQPFHALEELVSLGFHRILTSGQASNAMDGIPLLKDLVGQAAGRIIIMPGCGVNVGNAARILDATGAQEIHASLRAVQPSAMRYRHAGVSMGTPGTDEYATMETSVESVRAVVEAIG